MPFLYLKTNVLPWTNLPSCYSMANLKKKKEQKLHFFQCQPKTEAYEFWTLKNTLVYLGMITISVIQTLVDYGKRTAENSGKALDMVQALASLGFRLKDPVSKQEDAQMQLSLLKKHYISIYR